MYMWNLYFAVYLKLNIVNQPYFSKIFKNFKKKRKTWNQKWNIYESCITANYPTKDNKIWVQEPNIKHTDNGEFFEMFTCHLFF